jgi:tetratricopeptide (TPR) repeat protein
MLDRSFRSLGAAAWLLVFSSAISASTLPPVDLSGVSPEAHPAIEAARGEVAALGPTAHPSARADAWGRLGMLYLHERLLDAAEPCFKTAQEAQPSQMRWSYYLAVVQQKKGDLQNAAASLRQAMQVREGNLPVALRLAGVLVELGQLDEAAGLYQAALQSPYGAAPANAGLGRIALARGEAAKAVVFFEQALAAQPEASSLHHQLSLALAAAGNTQKSRAEAARSGPREVIWPDPLLAQLDFLSRSAPQAPSGDPQIDSLRRMVAASPDDAANRRSLAQALIKAGELAGAQEQYEEIVGRRQAEARDYLELGSLKAERQKDPATGLPDMEKALSLDPELYLAHQRLALLRYALGQTEQSIGHLQKALEIEPSLPEARLQLARIYFGQEKLPEAMAAVSELLRREPANFEAVLMRGRIHGGQNQAAEARRDFERVAAATGAAPSQRAEACFSLGLLHQASNDVESAIADYRRALEQDASHPPTLSALGAILAGRGDFEGALPLYQRLASRLPGNPEVQYRLAALQMQRGDLEEAHRLFEELYRAEPKVLEFVVTSSLLLAERGQADVGAARLERALGEQKEPQAKQRLLAARGKIEARAGKIDTAAASYRQALQLGDKPELRLELAQALALASRYPAALTEYAAYLKTRPQDVQTHFARAMVLVWAGRFGEARDRLVEVTAISQDVSLTHLLARILASAPDPKVRNGERAVQIAKAVFEKERNPVHGETLALALAAAGKFPEALVLQKRLLAEAEEAKFEPGFITRVKGNLERFEKGEVGVSEW